MEHVTATTMNAIIIVLAAIILLLTIIALFKIFNSKADVNQKAVWAVVVLAVPFLGAILYFIMGTSSDRTTN
ncbi:MAG: PLDc N-terminal domain-containing protein [Cyclobacteriaceae bacterium]